MYEDALPCVDADEVLPGVNSVYTVSHFAPNVNTAGRLSAVETGGEVSDTVPKGLVRLGSSVILELQMKSNDEATHGYGRCLGHPSYKK